MRTEKERIAAMHSRAAELKNHSRARMAAIAMACSMASGFAAAVLLAFYMPFLTENTVFGKMPAGMNASIFADNRSLGYIVTALIAFLLGIAVTVFCAYLKKWQDRKGEEDKV